jgi:hypothetical protein
MPISDIFKVAFSKVHIDNFENMYVKDEKDHVEVVKVMEKKN